MGMGCTDPQMQAWRALAATHAALSDRIQKALGAADLPPLSWCELLWAIKRTPSGRPRMSDLAATLTLSRGGVTKLVDRLEEAGYLARVFCPEDRRSLQAELTPAGERILGEMREVYEQEVARHLGALDAAEADAISASLTKVAQSACRAEGHTSEPAVAG